MTALLWVLGGGLASMSLSFVVLAFLNRKDNRETLAARELALGKDKQIAELESECATVKDKLKKETALRVSVESQRNQAFEEGVAHVVEKLKKSNIADVASFTATLLATPLPGWVPKAVPEKPRSETGPDALINPFESVQPPKDS